MAETSNTTNWEAAQSMYGEIKDARDKMDRIEKELKAMEAAAETGHIDWCIAGNAGFVSESLDPITEFLGV